MTRETQRMIKESKKRAAELVRYANPKSKSKPSIECVTEILLGSIPYKHSEGKPVITNIKITDYHENDIIKSARFMVEASNGRTFNITAYQNLTGRTKEQKEKDKNAMFPSELFNIFYEEIIKA